MERKNQFCVVAIIGKDAYVSKLFDTQGKADLCYKFTHHFLDLVYHSDEGKFAKLHLIECGFTYYTVNENHFSMSNAMNSTFSQSYQTYLFGVCTDTFCLKSFIMEQQNVSFLELDKDFEEDSFSEIFAN
ncbi:MAG: hypothetical protein K0S44_1148 [Bacteroidetes bacterium]|jgi:hypothetical protein|nr:hypothetical protein [Bacteroidota bacterium]